MALWPDYTLRHRGLRDQATISFVTPEAHLGHLATDVTRAETLLAKRFAQRGISVNPATVVERVDADAVLVQGGVRLPATFRLVLPAFSGVPAVWQTWGLTDTQGLAPVDDQYRHRNFPEIYAAGMAARLQVTHPIESATGEIWAPCSSSRR